MNSEIGKKRIYNDLFDYQTKVVHWDVLEIDNEQEIILEFIKVNSKYRQGVRLAIDIGEGYIEINGIQSKGIHLWEDTCPKRVKLKCISSQGKMSVYNIFDMGVERGGVKSQTDSSGMIIQETKEGILYRCNDVGFNSNFDKLEFKIQIL
ncbi:MAG: hypothetical protein IJE49_06635 [Agathobacter sp.]|nr:hypothetical protein [Agathobacter sp.]